MKPIIFNGEMVKAILDGRKVQTRRLVKWEPLEPGLNLQASSLSIGYIDLDSPELGVELSSRGEGACWNQRTKTAFPKYQPGDKLWVIQMKPIRDYEGIYWAGDDGNIYHQDPPKQMKACSTGGSGYLSVTLCKNGTRKTRSVHRLVCEAFYGLPPADMPQARHLNRNKDDNRAVNLDWGSYADNWKDRAFHGSAMGEKHHRAKLTEAQVIDIRLSDRPQRELARRFGVTQANISSICRNNTWAKASQPEPNFPRWASRITLEVTGVRCEQIQSISEADCYAEGIQPSDQLTNLNSLIEFRDLWQSIYPGSWEDNQWVFVYDFKTIDEGLGMDG